jgi:hypothetical protein
VAICAAVSFTNMNFGSAGMVMPCLR